MASTFSTSGSDIDRRSLKRPDGFMTSLSGIFSQLISKSSILAGCAVGLIAIGVGIALFMNQLESKSKNARNALFLAEKALAAEVKGFASHEVSKEANTTHKGQSDSSLDEVAFKKLDVDVRFPDGVQKLKAIVQEFRGTRAALDAQVKLGDLYYNHGEFSKALPWFEKAAGSSSGIEKATALSSMGYTYENLGQPQEAITFFQKAINLGEASLKGDLLLALGRCYEALHDFAKARSTYDKILSELSNTEYAKSAEIAKSQLQ